MWYQPNCLRWQSCPTLWIVSHTEGTTLLFVSDHWINNSDICIATWYVLYFAPLFLWSNYMRDYTTNEHCLTYIMLIVAMCT